MNHPSLSRSIVFLPLVCVLGACAGLPPDAAVLPQRDGSYLIVSTGDTEYSAYRNVEHHAQKICHDAGYVVLEHDSVYQGADKDTKADTTIADVAMFYFTGSNPKADRLDDYKVSLQVECR